MSELSLANAPVLELVKEKKLYELLSGSSPDDSFEATGVCQKGDHLFVIFADTPHIARLHNSLTHGHVDNTFYRRMVQTVGYEDIVYNEPGGRFLIITKPKKDDKGEQRPKVNEYSADLQFLEADWVDFTVEGKDKRLRGLELVRVGGQEYMLGLCAGNKCQGGRNGATPGKGRVQIFQNEGTKWVNKGTIKLPKKLLFEDYSAIAVQERRIAILSQATSAVWVGQLNEDGWDLVGSGTIYIFPKSKSGNPSYCNLGGVDWISADELVVVSERGRRSQSRRCRKNDQSIHIFKIPENA